MTVPTYSGRVFLLGAGASAQLTFRMTTLDNLLPPRASSLETTGPLSAGFFYYVNQFARSVQGHSPLFSFSHQPKADLISFVCDYAQAKLGQRISAEELLHNESQSRKVNIENLYRYTEAMLNEAQSLTEAMRPAGIARWLLNEYIAKALAYICHVCFSQHHRQLARSLEPGDTIISFNWDILMEQALHECCNWNYETGYGLRFEKISHRSQKDYVRHSRPSANLVLKPHGSVNWYADEDRQQQAVNLVIPCDWKLRGGNPALAIDRYVRGLGMAAISPPGSGQFALQNLRPLLKDALQQAREIIAIGFSFNQHDQHVKEEFSGYTFRDDLVVRLVNPDGKHLCSLYQEAFPTASIQLAAVTLKDFLTQRKLTAHQPAGDVGH